MDAYGATIKLARLPPVSRAAQPEYAATRDNLLEKWQILGGYAAVCLLLACLVLALRNEDR